MNVNMSGLKWLKGLNAGLLQFVLIKEIGNTCVITTTKQLNIVQLIIKLPVLRK